MASGSSVSSLLLNCILLICELLAVFNSATFRQLFQTVLLVPLVAAPDHCGPPGTAVSPVAVMQLLWLRNSTATPSCEPHLRVLLPGSSSLPGLLDLGYDRNHSHTHHQCLLRPT